MENDNYKRKEPEPPLAVEKWGWRYHHLGIPTATRKQGEVYLSKLKFWVSGFDRSPFGIEWMRFDEDSPVHELIRTIPHLAFEVEDIDLEIKRYRLKVITKPNAPSDGIKVAVIEHNGAPIELIEFEDNKYVFR